MSASFIIILLSLLLLASAFFSGSETALFSVSSSTLQGWRESGSASQKLAARLMDDQHGTLTTILLGNNFVNILTAVVFHQLLRDELIAGPEAPVIAGFAVTGILLVFGEVSPKTIAYAKARKLAPRVAPLIKLLATVLYPLVAFLKGISGAMLKLLGGPKTSTAISVDEYQTFVDLAGKMGVFSPDELTMFNKVFALREIRVSQIMIPRTDVKCVERTLTAQELTGKIREHRHRYLPVVTGGLDKVDGVLDVARFHRLKPKWRKNWQLTCLFSPIFVPESVSVNRALAQLREAKQGIAFVVDEYGGVEGLITLEDIYEQVVGELSDEFDQPEWQITAIKAAHWRLSGLIPLTQLHAQLGFELPESKADSLGGFLAEQLEHIPSAGEAVKLADCRFVVRSVHRNRVLEVDLLEDPGKEEASA